jgi:hypothetical protein
MTEGEQRRGEDRHGIHLAATVRAYRQPALPATVRDLSSRGALLKVEAPGLAIGDEVVLTAEKHEVVATIAWQKDGFFGLSFHRTLEPRELATLRAADTG